LLLLLAGCASEPLAPDMSVTTSQQTPPHTPIEASVEPKPDMSRNPAVLAMLDRAQQDAYTGHREAAGATLERGLRIEPHNAWLWQELAQLRLNMGQYAQAISLAQKSLSFAARNYRLQALNWRIIGNANAAQGNHAEAEQAFGRATALTDRSEKE
jgi:predicted Zn-dependent protease